MKKFFTFFLGNEADSEMPLKGLLILTIIKFLLNPLAKIYFFSKRNLIIVHDLIFGDNIPEDDKNKDIGFINAVSLIIKSFCYALAYVLDKISNWIIEKFILIFFPNKEKE
jgi:hypothetical protein